MRKWDIKCKDIDKKRQTKEMKNEERQKTNNNRIYKKDNIKETEGISMVNYRS